MICKLRPANVIVLVTTISECELKESPNNNTVRTWKCNAKNVKNHATQSKLIVVDVFPDDPEIAVALVFKTGVEIILAMLENNHGSQKRDDQAPYLKVTSGERLFHSYIIYVSLTFLFNSF